ncbi:hypothetical protein ACFVQB_14770 [Paenibacillus sp. NPDC057886]|uniref:hypothetical protein n=1 Tax=Paenibacillus sp. NPDC057886 TaxID=3346270 RepID=UPI0036CEAB29
MNLNLYSITPVGILENKARMIISETLPNLLEKISYSVESYIPLKAKEIARLEDTIADGVYEDGVIYLHSQSLIETAIHEIGHAIHYQLFDAKDLKLSKKHFKNHKEEFAELFSSMVLKLYNKQTLNVPEHKLRNLIFEIIQ